MKRIKNHYVLTYHFDGNGKGHAIGFDNYGYAVIFATIFLLGFARILTEAELEQQYPCYFHHLVSQTY